jgi:accessory gene regulator protein AgrB
MNMVSLIISNWLLSKNYITTSQKKDIVFSLEVVLSNALSFISIIMLGLLMDYWNYTIIYVLVFIAFRTMRDRYHAKTFLSCYILTVGSFLLCLLLVIIIPNDIQRLLTIMIGLVNCWILLSQEKITSKAKKILQSDFFVISFMLLSGLIFYWAVKDYNPRLFLVTLILSIIVITSNKPKLLR